MSTISEREEVLLSLLAHELFQKNLKIDASAVDWAYVIDEATRHAVIALLYPGMRQMRGVPEDILGKVRGAAITSTLASEGMLESQQAVIKLLQERHLPCAVLKGTSVACLYPHPELRVPGDIDLLVNAEDQEVVGDALEENHYVLVDTDDMHTCYQKSSVRLEIHSMVSVFPDNEKGDFTKNHMVDALCYVQTAQACGVSFPVLTGNYQILALLTHMERHFGEFGIGLRQLCDWAVMVHAQREEIGEAELTLLNRCGLLHFAKIVTKLCEKYLGLPPCAWSVGVPDKLTEALMHDILDAGNFQSQYQQSFRGVLTRGMQMDENENENNVKNTSLRSYSQYIHNRIQQEYPWAKGRLWIAVFGFIYPFQWIVQMLLGKRKKVNLSQAIISAKKRENLLRELQLYK